MSGLLLCLFFSFHVQNQEHPFIAYIYLETTDFSRSFQNLELPLYCNPQSIELTSKSEESRVLITHEVCVFYLLPSPLHQILKPVGFSFCNYFWFFFCNVDILMNSCMRPLVGKGHVNQLTQGKESCPDFWQGAKASCDLSTAWGCPKTPLDESGLCFLHDQIPFKWAVYCFLRSWHTFFLIHVNSCSIASSIR